MPESDDIPLLRQYAETGSESAFATLVERHVHLVYSVAWRTTGNKQAAEDIAQAVFIILARKARSLSKRTILSGWFYQTTRLTAANFLRGEIRRQKREQEAFMQSTLNDVKSEAWLQIAPMLDEAISRLGQRDRDALILRFFENKNLYEIGAAMGASEGAAKMRVNRALEKLRKFFARRGAISTATAIGETISANSVQAAPISLAKTISVVALAKGAAASIPTLTLVKGTMKTMTWLKLKFAMGVGAVALLAGGAAVVAVSQTGGGNKLTGREILKESQNAYAALSSYRDHGTVVFAMGNQTVTTSFDMRLQRPNLYRIEWTQANGLYTNQGAVWSDGSGNYLQMTAPAFLTTAARQKATGQVQAMPDRRTALARAMPLSSFATSTIPGMFFNQNVGDFSTPTASGRYPLKQEADTLAGGVDCYVVSSPAIDLSKIPGIGKPGTVTTTFWIGKKDFLIHQCRLKYVEKAAANTPTPAQIDEAIKTSLKMQNKPVTPEAIAALRPQMKKIMAQVQSTLKSGFESGVVYTQTHQAIALNPKFSPADFAR